MNRREFLKWGLAGAGAVGVGRLIGGFYRKNSDVTILDVPQSSRDFHRDLAKVMLDDGLVLRGKKVLLKPNFVEYHQGRPINTDIQFIRQVAEACLMLGAREVIVGEAAGHRRDPWYSVYHPSVRKELPQNVRPVDMNHGDVVKLPNKGYYTKLSHFYVAEPVVSADVVISLPKMKTHHWVGVTLSMKNLFGTLSGLYYGWPKNLLHINGIESSILDLSMTVPVHYAIIDGIVGMEGDGPILGTPKHVGVVIMGRNLLAVDCTAARIMGFDPYKIYYLARAGFHLPGLDETTIVHRGETPKRYATTFKCLPQFQKCQGGPFW